MQFKSSVVSEDVAETDIEEVAQKISKKKKKKEADAAANGVTELADCADVTPREETDLLCGDSVNDLCEEEPRKKKKKKKKHQEEQDPALQASDSSGYQSDHKKKRKKRKQSVGMDSVT